MVIVRGTVRVRQGYSQGTAGVQSGYSRGTAGVQWGIVGTSWGTVVVGGRIYQESIKITQKLVTVATAFFFTVLPFFVSFCRVYVTFVSNALQRRF